MSKIRKNKDKPSLVALNEANYFLDSRNHFLWNTGHLEPKTKFAGSRSPRDFSLQTESLSSKTLCFDSGTCEKNFHLKSDVNQLSVSIRGTQTR